MQWTSPNPEATRAAAAQLARVLAGRGLVVALAGPLGAGKTVFVQGLAEGLGIDPGLVVSPTFVVANEYPLPDGRRLAHVDLYRLRSEAELEAAGFLDLLEPDTLLAIEWSDRLPDALPCDRLEVRLARPDAAAPSRRVLNAVAFGESARSVLRRWREALQAEGIGLGAGCGEGA